MADKYITIAGTSYRYKKTDGGGGDGGDTPTPGANWISVNGGNIPGGNYFLRFDPALDLGAIGGVNGHSKFHITFYSNIGNDINADGTYNLGETYYINSLPASSDTPFYRATVDHLRWLEEKGNSLWIGSNPAEASYDPQAWRDPEGSNNGVDNEYPDLGYYMMHSTGGVTNITDNWDAAKIGNLLKQRNITVPRYSTHSLVWSYETAQENAAIDLWKQIAWLAPSKGDKIILTGDNSYEYECRVLDIDGTVAKVMFMNPIIKPDDGYYPTGAWPDTTQVGINRIYEGSAPQTLINEWLNTDSFPADLKGALVAHDFKLSYFNNDTVSWIITGDALPYDLQLRASRFTTNQIMMPLTLTDVVNYCGIDTDLTGGKIISMLGMNYSENCPVELMSVTNNNDLFYVNKTTGEITTNSNGIAAIYPVAYIDLNFLTTTVDNVGWIMGPRETSHKYTLNYDTYSTIEDGNGIAPTPGASATDALLVNSTNTTTITNLTAKLANNLVKIEFYAYTNGGKSLKINNETFVIDGDTTSDVIREFVNTDINIEFVTNTGASSGQRHFVLYFTQTNDYIATNYPELLIDD